MARTTTTRIPDPVKPVVRSTCLWAFSIALALASLLAAAGHAAMARGLALGALFGAADLLWTASNLSAKLGTTAKQARARGFGFAAIRYAAKAVPLIAAIQWARIDFFMTVLGLFLIQICLLIVGTRPH